MADPERTCVVCRSQIARHDGIRFVLDPAGAPAVDLRGRLPGRGAHCCAKAECLQGLRRRKALSRAFRQEVPLPPEPWPLDLLTEHSRSRQRELIGLAGRSGALRSGGGVVERALRGGGVAYVLLAADAGPTVASDLEKAARAREVPVLRTALSAEELGRALGRAGPRSVAALRAGKLADSLRKELIRARAFI